MADGFTIELEFRNQRWTDAAAGLRAFYDILGKDWDGSAKVLSREMKSFLIAIADAIATRNSNGWPGGTTPTSLSQRTGTLNEAILNSPEVTGETFENIRGAIGAPGVKYALIQETGGVISAKNGKFLAIPLPAAMTSDGVPLLPGPRNWPNTFVARTKNGNLVIFMKKGVQIVPLYVLKPQVTIPARLKMGETLDTGLPYFVDQAMDKMVKAVVGANA